MRNGGTQTAGRPLMSLYDQGILDEIRMLASQGETGKLQITAGMTEGALFFNKGQLVDARVGKLTGFQAINAVASIPDATFNFDPTIAPPVQSSIKANERLLLKDFFGIDAVERDEVHGHDGVIWPDDNDVPERVVPLTEVESSSTQEPANEHSIAAENEEVTLVNRSRPATTTPPDISNGRTTRRDARPVLFVTALMMLLVAAAVFAIVYRARERTSAPSTAATAPASTPTEVPQASPAQEVAAPDLTGNWTVVNTVEQTSYQPFRDMKVGFNLAIDQSGTEFTGRGEKVSENGRNLPQTSRTPIELKGTIDGDRVEATFSESGAARKTSGRFVWRVDKASGGLTGTFVSTAARARGKSAATKQF